MKEMITKIKAIYLNKRYGFNDGGTIVVGHYYKNHRPVKGMSDTVFCERSAFVENYAMECGINREDQLHTLEGMQVGVEFENENIEGKQAFIKCLTRPYKISLKLGKPQHEFVLGMFDSFVDEEDIV